MDRPETRGEGLLILSPRKVTLTGPDAGKLPITVFNYLEEEIFLEVDGYGSIGANLETFDGGSVVAGGGGIVFPDNAGLLKRLHAASYRPNGQRVVCGCAAARIDAKLSEMTLSEGRARGHVTFLARGFYRSTGKAFSEWIDLPVELVEVANNPGGGGGERPAPATAPAAR